MGMVITTSNICRVNPLIVKLEFQGIPDQCFLLETRAITLYSRQAISSMDSLGFRLSPEKSHFQQESMVYRQVAQLRPIILQNETK